MGSFTAMTAFITGAVWFMTGLMRLALTRDALRSSVGEPAMGSDTDQPCETSFISSRAAAHYRIRAFLDQIFRGLTIQIAVTSDELCSDPPIRQPISENL